MKLFESTGTGKPNLNIQKFGVDSDDFLNQMRPTVINYKPVILRKTVKYADLIRATFRIK
jgi:hypothetical protein